MSQYTGFLQLRLNLASAIRDTGDHSYACGSQSYQMAVDNCNLVIPSARTLHRQNMLGECTASMERKSYRGCNE